MSKFIREGNKIKNDFDEMFLLFESTLADCDAWVGSGIYNPLGFPLISTYETRINSYVREYIFLKDGKMLESFIVTSGMLRNIFDMLEKRYEELLNKPRLQKERSSMPSAAKLIIKE